MPRLAAAQTRHTEGGEDAMGEGIASWCTLATREANLVAPGYADVSSLRYYELETELDTV
jgi:hypothetical protein